MRKNAITPYSARERVVVPNKFPPSLTTPEQSMSIQQILDKHKKGLPIRGLKDPIFDDPERPSTGIHLNSLDLVDLQRLKLEVHDQLQKSYHEKQKKDALDRMKTEEDKKRKWREEFEAEQKKALIPS